MVISGSQTYPAPGAFTAVSPCPALKERQRPQQACPRLAPCTSRAPLAHPLRLSDEIIPGRGGWHGPRVNRPS